MKGKQTLLLLAALLLYGSSALAATTRVQVTDIEKTVFGSGMVQPAHQPGVYADIDATVGEWYVSVGDTVKAGDVLMSLENDTVEKELAQAHYDMETAQHEILYTKTHEQYTYRQIRNERGDLRFDTNTGEPLMGQYSNEITVRAPCDGRIMAIYIEEGSDALAVFREKGAVMVLSTDGRMKVELESDNPMDLVLGEKVWVTGKDKWERDFKIEGAVTSLTRYGMEAQIQIETDGYPLDAEVTVSKKTGEAVGVSTLKVNKPMAVSAYGGTIKGVPSHLKVGSYVERYDVLARIVWKEIPLYIDNDKVLHEFAVAKASYEKAEKKLESLAAVAPCDGVVASIDVEKGDDVTDGTKLMSVVDTGAGMKLTLSIDELDIPAVAPGQEVHVWVDALEDVELHGVVDKIAPLGNTEESVTTYDVYVTLTGDVDARVRGGMNVSGEIVIGAAKSALTVPTDALQKSGEGWTVALPDGSSAAVEIGIMTDSRTQILSGLSEGQSIVY